jgi:hypothetical protein
MDTLVRIVQAPTFFSLFTREFVDFTLLLLLFFLLLLLLG